MYFCTVAIIAYSTYPIPSRFHCVAVEEVHTHTHTQCFFLLLMAAVLWLLRSMYFSYLFYLSICLFACLPTYLIQFQCVSLPNRLFHCFLFILNTIQRNACSIGANYAPYYNYYLCDFSHLNVKNHYFNLKLREQQEKNSSI